jgi:pimeloyl-ACP methyl ester carboxylesterase
MKISKRVLMLGIAFATSSGLFLSQSAFAQPPGGRGGLNRGPDPRVEQRSYHFEETSEELGYALFVSSKVSKDEKAPLIVALHGLGGDGNSLLRGRALELAEEGGYILVGPLGYNPSGWFGSPVIVMGGRRGAAPAAAAAPAGPEPERLAELSELDVRTVMTIIRDEFTVDDDRTYLMGHSMGGAGALFLGQKYADEWAAVASIAPAAFLMQPNSAEILQPMKDADIPLLIIQGGADTVVPPTNTREWAASMEAVGIEGEYIEMPEGDHGSVINDGMPAIFELFEGNTR